MDDLVEEARCELILRAQAVDEWLETLDDDTPEATEGEGDLMKPSDRNADHARAASRHRALREARTM